MVGMDRDLSINEAGEATPHYRTEEELLQSMGYKQVYSPLVPTYIVAYFFSC